MANAAGLVADVRHLASLPPGSRSDWAARIGWVTSRDNHAQSFFKKIRVPGWPTDVEVYVDFARDAGGDLEAVFMGSRRSGCGVRFDMDMGVSWMFTDSQADEVEAAIEDPPIWPPAWSEDMTRFATELHAEILNTLYVP
jgi:hypothetical protein